MAKSKKATEALIVKTGRGHRPQLATSGGGVLIPDGGVVAESRESTMINLDGNKPLFEPTKTIITERTYEPGAVVANIGRVDLRLGVEGDHAFSREKRRKMIRRARKNDVVAIRSALRGLDRARANYHDAVKKAWTRGRYIETKEEAVEAITAAGFDLREWPVSENPDEHPLVFNGGKQARTLRGDDR